MNYDVIIIGAGAAGLWAGANLSSNLTALILEHSKSPGKKLLMTGGGQCNVTHAGSIKEFLIHYGNQGSRLRSVLYPFNNQAVQDFFSRSGLSLVTREDGKIFPEDLSSRSVLNLLLHRCKENGIPICCDQPVLHTSQDPHTLLFTVATDQKEYQCKHLIVATGGCSYPTTGSDGSFFPVLEQLGISLIPRSPALVPITVSDYSFQELAGISFSDASLTIWDSNRKKRTERRDDLLLTHEGFSGPLILNSSRFIHQGDSLSINYIPGYTTQSLSEYLKNTSVKNRKAIFTLVQEVTALPKRFIEQILSRISISPQQKCSQCSGKTLQEIAAAFTSDSHLVSGTGSYKKAMVTAGGVNLDQVNLKTMESKEIPHLYFAGEVLDVDGDTGGYNLQFAFSSAMVAVRTIQALI